MEDDELINRLSLDSNNSGSSKVRVKAAGDNQFTFELNEETGEEVLPGANLQSGKFTKFKMKKNFKN